MDSDLIKAIDDFLLEEQSLEGLICEEGFNFFEARANFQRNTLGFAA